jgi:hypothetical protein
MATSKGKFVKMAYSILELNPEAQKEALQNIKRLTGEEYEQLDPEGWYDTSVIESIFQVAEKHYGTLMAWATIKTMGRRVFPTIKKTVGFPKELRTPLDWIKWEGHTLFLTRMIQS